MLDIPVPNLRVCCKSSNDIRHVGPMPGPLTSHASDRSRTRHRQRKCNRLLLEVRLEMEWKGHLDRPEKPSNGVLVQRSMLPHMHATCTTAVLIAGTQPTRIGFLAWIQSRAGILDLGLCGSPLARISGRCLLTLMARVSIQRWFYSVPLPATAAAHQLSIQLTIQLPLRLTTQPIQHPHQHTR